MALPFLGIANISVVYNKSNLKMDQSSHPHLTLINDFFQAYASNDEQAIGKVLDPEIKWHIPGSHQLSGTKTGIEEVLAFFKELEKGAFKAEPIATGVNGDYVVDCHRNWSELEGDDKFEAMSCLLWKIEDGRIVEVFNFPQDQKVVDSFFKKVYG